MFSEVGWQQAADAVIRKEHVKVPQQTALGFVRLVLRLQDLQRDDLPQQGHIVISDAITWRSYCDQKNILAGKTQVVCIIGLASQPTLPTSIYMLFSIIHYKIFPCGAMCLL